MMCDVCGGPMTPMISSWFCPRDCDRRPTAPPWAEFDTGDCLVTDRPGGSWHIYYYTGPGELPPGEIRQYWVSVNAVTWYGSPLTYARKCVDVKDGLPGAAVEDYGKLTKYISTLDTEFWKVSTCVLIFLWVEE